MDYQAYIESPEWRERAKDATSRAAYKCQICSCPRNLNAHHNTYDRIGKELPTDICILCNRCHDLFHCIKRDKPTRMPDDQRHNPKKKRGKYQQATQQDALARWNAEYSRREAKAAYDHISRQMKEKGAVSPRIAG